MENSNVLLGFTIVQDFPSILMDGLEIDRVKADAIVEDLNDQLFNKIRDAMKKVYEQNTAPEPVVVQNPPAMEKSVVMPSAAAPTPVAINKVEQSLPAPVTPPAATKA